MNWKYLRSVYLQGVAGVVLCGLVFEGLTQKNGALVVYLIPVFAVAHVQCGFDVAGAFLVTQMDLHTQKKTAKLYKHKENH